MRSSRRLPTGASGATANLAGAAEKLQDQKTKLADVDNNIKSMFSEE
jgi:hypothetical protein